MEPVANRILHPVEVERLFRTTRGWATRQAKAGRLPYITLPDGQIRFVHATIERIIAAGSLPMPMGVPGVN